jgi:hypothetical protein
VRQEERIKLHTFFVLLVELLHGIDEPSAFFFVIVQKSLSDLLGG